MSAVSLSATSLRQWSLLHGIFPVSFTRRKQGRLRNCGDIAGLLSDSFYGRRAAQRGFGARFQPDLQSPRLLCAAFVDSPSSHSGFAFIVTGRSCEVHNDARMLSFSLLPVGPILPGEHRSSPRASVANSARLSCGKGGGASASGTIRSRSRRRASTHRPAATRTSSMVGAWQSRTTPGIPRVLPLYMYNASACALPRSPDARPVPIALAPTMCRLMRASRRSTTTA